MSDRHQTFIPVPDDEWPTVAVIKATKGAICGHRINSDIDCDEPNGYATFQILYWDFLTVTWLVWGDTCYDHLGDNIDQATAQVQHPSDAIRRHQKESRTT